MDEDEVTLDLSTYPRQGDTSGSRTVIFGPASDKFAFLVEIDPESDTIDVTIGNSGAVSELPSEISTFLRELADEIEDLASTPQFLEWIYGTPSENDED